LAEGLLLSAIGGLSGILLAGWGVEAIRRLALQQFSRAGEIRMDAAVLLFAVCASLLCGVAFGLAPAWTATRDALARSVRTPRVGTSPRGLLVTAEVAMAFVLLAGAGLLMQSLWKLWHVDTGFSKDQVLTLKVAPRLSRFRNVGQVAAFYEGLLAQIRDIPGVRAAGAVGNVPLSGERSGTGIAVENRPAAPGESLEANYQLAGPGYFAAMGIPLLAGRDFNAADVKGAPEVVIINHALAELCWPGQDAVGRHIRLGPNSKDPWATVVGVIGNVKHDQLALPPRPEAYENYFQHSWGGMNLAVRRDPQAAHVAAAIRAQIRLADPDIPIPAALSMDEVIATSLRDRRFLMWMLGAFAGCAILLAAIGIYGVIAYSVEQRIREIGIRVALGADRPEVTRLVLSGGMRMAAAGIVTGGAAALGLTRVLRSMLFEVKPGDPATLAVAAAVLIAVAILACLIPARRATRIEAAVALRHQ
jgi:putative ABC transport system permease protein